MCNNTHGRLEEETSVAALFLVCPTFVLIFHLIHYQTIYDHNGDIVYAAPAIWLCLLATLIASIRKKNCICPLLISFIAFYIVGTPPPYTRADCLPGYL